VGLFKKGNWQCLYSFSTGCRTSTAGWLTQYWLFIKWRFAARSISNNLSSAVDSRCILIFFPVIILLLTLLSSEEEEDSESDPDDELELPLSSRSFFELCLRSFSRFFLSFFTRLCLSWYRYIYKTDELQATLNEQQGPDGAAHLPFFFSFPLSLTPSSLSFPSCPF